MKSRGIGLFLRNILIIDMNLDNVEVICISNTIKYNYPFGIQLFHSFEVKSFSLGNSYPLTLEIILVSHWVWIVLPFIGLLIITQEEIVVEFTALSRCLGELVVVSIWWIICDLLILTDGAALFLLIISTC